MSRKIVREGYVSNRPAHETRQKRPATWCHPDQPYVAKGYCVKCYPATRREASRVSLRRSRFKASLRKFGLTAAAYDALLSTQGGGCAICGGPLVGRQYFCLDHNHETGQVRGLLCNPCNTGLGLFRDDVKRLRRAAQYLERYS